jgi:hypothetical protein
MSNEKPGVVAEVGGPVDESSTVLAVYGDTLDPSDVTGLLGVQPTRSFSPGHSPGPRSPPSKHGAWFLEVRGMAPLGPEELLRELLSKLPTNAYVWAKLHERYKVQLRVAIHMQGWNKGFSLTPPTVAQLASMGVGIEVDLYAYDA